MSWLIPSEADRNFVANLNRDDDSMRLATLLAPALRIDATLLRNMRLRYLPRSDAGLESTLWFSDLVVSRSARAISFSPGIACLLTGELEADQQRPILSEVTGFIQRHAADWPRETRLEQRLRLAARADDIATVRKGLRIVLRWFDQAADDNARNELLRWVRGAVPGLVRPEWSLQEAHWLTQIAAATLGDTTGELAASNRNAERVPSWLSHRLPADQGTELGLNVRPGQLQFVEAGAGAHNLAVGPAIPALLGLQLGDDSETHWEQVWAGQILPIPQETRRLTLISLSGKSYDLLIEEQLNPSRETTRAQVRLPERIRLLHLPEEEKEAQELAARLQAMGISVNAVIDDPDRPRRQDKTRHEPDRVPAIRLWTRYGAKRYASMPANADAWQGLVVRLEDIPLPEGIQEVSPIDLFEGRNRFSEQGLERLRGALMGGTPPLSAFRDTLKDGSQGPEMIVIPAGQFEMGCGSGQDCQDDELPVRTVTFGKPFAIGKYELTFDEYERFATATGGRKPDNKGWGRGRRPVINVSWDEARKYAAWLSERTGKHYRLPTEAEWEYAARAGTQTRWSFGDDKGALGKYAWYEGNSDSMTHPVGEKRANPWGLYDVHGNVWEWTEDCWHGNYEGAPKDGSAWEKADDGDCGRRVIRGGSWGSGPRGLRSATRGRDGPDGWRHLPRFSSRPGPLTLCALSFYPLGVQGGE